MARMMHDMLTTMMRETVDFLDPRNGKPYTPSEKDLDRAYMGGHYCPYEAKTVLLTLC